MIKTLFYKEILLRIYSRFYLISMSIIVILMILCGIFSVRNYQFKNNKYGEIVAEKNELLEYDNENMWSLFREIRTNEKTVNTFCDLAFLNQLAVLKPSTLSLVSNGNDHELPNGITFNYFNIGEFEDHKTDYSLLEFNNNLDILTLIVMFMSFVIIVLTHDSISGEKYGGTLKLISSYSVNKSSILISKYLADIFLIFCPFLIGLLINMLIIILSKNIGFGTYEIYRILFFIFFVFLFFSLQIFMFYLISSLTSTPNFSLLISTFVWIVLVVIVPNTTWLIARIVKQVPTRENIVRTEEQLREDNPCAWSWDSRWISGGAPPQELYNLADCLDKMDVLHNNLYIDYRNQLFNQTELAINISSVSPYYNFRFLSEKIADNGYFRFKNFYHDLLQHRIIFRDFINTYDKQDPDSHHVIFNFKYLCQAFMSKKQVDKSLIPQFIYNDRINFIELIKLCSKEIVILLLWLIGIIILLIRSFIRYDVR